MRMGSREVAFRILLHHVVKGASRLLSYNSMMAFSPTPEVLTRGKFGLPKVSNFPIPIVPQSKDTPSPPPPQKKNQAVRPSTISSASRNCLRAVSRSS